MSTIAFQKKIDEAEANTGSARHVTGHFDARALRIGIVVSRFNSTYTKQLVEHAVKTLSEHGVAEEKITIVWVPGAYEIPLLVKQLAVQKEFSALVALGVVIQGKTPHADLINSTVVRALADIAIAYDTPVVDGVVTARDESQARERCDPAGRGRGGYAASVAVETATVLHNVRNAPGS